MKLGQSIKRLRVSKAEEILDKHLELRSWTKTVPKHGNLYNTLLDAVNEALNMPVVSNNEVAFCENCERYKLLLKKPAYCKYCGTRMIT